MENEQKPKQKLGFTIIKDDPIDGHKGYGVGSLSLENVSPVFIDVEEEFAFLDIGAMHARSEIEKRIKFTMNREDSEGGKPYWLVWVTIDFNPDGPYYAGITACEMVVNKEKRRGYKNLADHVNLMDKSMKRKLIFEHMDEKSKRVLGEYLKSHNEELWQRSLPELRQGLLGEQ